MDQPNIHPVSNIFHRLAKDTVVREFEKIFLKLILCLGTKVRIQINVWFQLCFFTERDSAINLFEFQTHLKMLFQILIMKNLLLLAFQIGNKFFFRRQFLNKRLVCLFIIIIAGCFFTKHVIT